MKITIKKSWTPFPHYNDCIIIPSIAIRKYFQKYFATTNMHDKSYYEEKGIKLILLFLYWRIEITIFKIKLFISGNEVIKSIKEYGKRTS